MHKHASTDGVCVVDYVAMPPPPSAMDFNWSTASFPSRASAGPQSGGCESRMSSSGSAGGFYYATPTERGAIMTHTPRTPQSPPTPPQSTRQSLDNNHLHTDVDGRGPDPLKPMIDILSGRFPSPSTPPASPPQALSPVSTVIF